MAKRMLIDAAHPEETRVVVTGGTRLEEFDFESLTKKQVKGNIYLAKVTRVEPSLQAAFIDYGGNRHGFLAFSEIHPDYYRIPVGDRRGESAMSGEDEASPSETGGDGEEGVSLAAALPEPVAVPEIREDDGESEPGARSGNDFAPETHDPAATGESDAAPLLAEADRPGDPEWNVRRTPDEAIAPEYGSAPEESAIAAEWEAVAVHEAVGDSAVVESMPAEAAGEALRYAEPVALLSSEEAMLRAEVGEGGELLYGRGDNGDFSGEPLQPAQATGESVETFGGDEVEEVEEADAEHRRAQPARHYKIQEVIKRRQIMLVQVAKEERGNKGAALTTYLSLAGRYCVLMPNTNRGGGVSRKITSIADRRRLKDILEELEIPEGMGVIVRTAGAERSKAEIKRDYEYLLRLWNEIRDLTLQSTAPALIYEEGNLIKRSIRDLYTRDIDEVLVEGEEGYRTAKAFMRTLMPSHAKRVQPYRDPQVGLFHRFQIESQIDAIHSPVAQLRSGGYLVINQTEALVAIDVNSGRSTRERNIEETALRTNLEAAEEIARQLRLRDLAGLIVIDFIDMEEHRNQIAVERRLKDALKNDRARIQIGRISPFGLLEMSRQRLRPSLAETSTQPCPHCGGTGFIRSVESAALHVLRSIEEEGIRRRSAEICIYVPTNVALYILNQKRDSLNQIEARYGIKVIVAQDDTLIPPAFRLDRLRSYGAGEAPPLRPIQAPTLAEEEDGEDEEAVTEAEAAEDTGSEEERARRRRPRRRRRKEPREAATAGNGRDPAEAAEAGGASHEGDEAQRETDAERRNRRRRGRRGGRMRPRRDEAAAEQGAAASAEEIEILPLATVEPEPPADGEAAPEPQAWPAESGFETASLAPFAGDETGPGSPPAAPYRDAAHREPEREPEPEPTAEAEEGVPFVGETERMFEDAAASAASASDAAVVEPAEPEPAAPSYPADDVRTVTEKPANPRRGWWQRLIQP